MGKIRKSKLLANFIFFCVREVFINANIMKSIEKQ